MASKSTKLMRQLVGNSDVKIYNDKLVDGSRSYKVVGWGLTDYQVAAQIFKNDGYDATVTVKRSFCGRTLKYILQPRLLVSRSYVNG